MKNTENIRFLQKSFSKFEEKKKVNEIYFIIDEKVLYHCGTSINRIGYKIFSITKVTDDCVLKLLLSKINNEDNLLNLY